MKNKAIERAISIIGSQEGLAKVCNKTQTSAWKWLHNKLKVKADYVPLIVKATGGQVKASDLRPDLPDLFPPE